MNYLVSVIIALSLGSVGSYAFKRYDAIGGDSIAGSDKYVMNCLSCHGDSGHGDGIIAASLPETPSNISVELENFFNYDSVLIKRIVLKGKTEEGMPTFEGLLSQQDVRDIFAYIRAINQ